MHLLESPKQLRLPEPDPELHCLSIVFPFEPTVMRKSELESRVKGVQARAEALLMTAYTLSEITETVSNLAGLLRDLNCMAPCRGISIFISREKTQVIYLDIPVRERIRIDDPSAAAAIELARVKTPRYLLLALDEHESLVYDCAGGESRLVKFNLSNIAWCPRVNRDSSDRAKEASTLADFVKKMDQGLSFLLMSHPFPVFVVATSPVMSIFRKLTVNAISVLAYILQPGPSVDDADPATLLKPYLGDWAFLRQSWVLRRVETAREENILTRGLRPLEGRHHFRHKSMLVLETGLAGSDGIVEKVLSGGGVVESVTKGTLSCDGGIVLIEEGRGQREKMRYEDADEV